MTISVATAIPAFGTTPKARRDRTLLLMLPAWVMLIGMFLAPLVLFFVRTFSEFDGTTAEFIERNAAEVTSAVDHQASARHIACIFRCKKDRRSG